MRLKVYQRFDAISLGEAVSQPLPVFVNSLAQIVRHTDVKRSTGSRRREYRPNSYAPGRVRASGDAPRLGFTMAAGQASPRRCGSRSRSGTRRAWGSSSVTRRPRWRWPGCRGPAAPGLRLGDSRGGDQETESGRNPFQSNQHGLILLLPGADTTSDRMACGKVPSGVGLVSVRSIPL